MSNEAAAPVEATPVYKHSLSGHAVQGDGTFEETTSATATDDYRQEKLPEFNDFAKAVSGEEEKADKPMEPLPELPPMPMTVDDAYKFLGVDDKDKGSLDKVLKRNKCSTSLWSVPGEMLHPTAGTQIECLTTAISHGHRRKRTHGSSTYISNAK